MASKVRGAIRTDRVFDVLAQASKGKTRAQIVGQFRDWIEANSREGVLERGTIEGYHDADQGLHLNGLLAVRSFIATQFEYLKFPACVALLEEIDEHLVGGRDQRHMRTLNSQFADVTRDELGLVGAYLVIRQETTDRRLVRDVLVLSRANKKKATKYATFVSSDVVLRGTWAISEAAICVSALGFRLQHEFDVINLLLARNLGGTATLMGGVMNGMTTLGRAPVAVSVICMPVGSPSDWLMSAGDRSDEELIERIAKLPPLDLERPDIAALRQDQYFQTMDIQPAHPGLTSLRNKLSNFAHLVDPIEATFK